MEKTMKKLQRKAVQREEAASTFPATCYLLQFSAVLSRSKLAACSCRHTGKQRLCLTACAETAVIEAVASFGATGVNRRGLSSFFALGKHPLFSVPEFQLI